MRSIMKTIVLVLLFLSTSAMADWSIPTPLTIIDAMEDIGESDEVKQRNAYNRARKRGAMAKVVFRVVDDEGKPVENARARASLYYKSIAKSLSFEDLTDSKGEFVIEGLCTDDVYGWRVEKEGYYYSCGSIWLADEDKLKDGKWQPYGMIKEVVLKRIKNQVELVRVGSNLRLKIPKMGEYLGFDLEEHDWIKPYGKGERADIWLKYEWNGESGTKKSKTHLWVKTDSKNDGFVMIKQDKESLMNSAYKYPTSSADEVTELKFCREFDPVAYEVKNSLSLEDDMILVRSRTIKDDDGNIKHCNYSKIFWIDYYAAYTPPVHFLDIRYTYNPRDMENNLEADPSKNLFKYESPINGLGGYL